MKVLGNIGKGGGVRIDTVKGAGGGCKKVADELGNTLGKADEATRRDTSDLYEEISQETQTKLEVDG